MNPQDTQPPIETPQPVPAFQPPAASHPTPEPQPSIQPAGEDPGKTLAIIGIILAFFFNVVGLILSIIARSKSKKAGYPTTLATIGIVLNSVFILLSVLAISLLVIITLAAYNNIEERAESQQYTTDAHSIIKKAEAYYAVTGSYPVSISEFNAEQVSTLTEQEIDGITDSPLAPGEDDIYVLTCGADKGIAVEYWDSSTAITPSTLYAGELDSIAECTPIPLTTSNTPPAQVEPEATQITPPVEG